ERELDAARQPLLELGERLAARLKDIRLCALYRRRPMAARIRLQPVARFFLDGDVDAGLEPPRQRAARVARSQISTDHFRFPPTALSSPPLTPRSRNGQ